MSSQFPKHRSNPHFSHNVYSQAVQLLPTCSHPESGHPRVNLTLTGLQKDLSISNLEYQGSAPVPGGLGYMYIRRHLLGLLPRLIHLLSNPSTFHLIIPNLISEYFRVFGFSLIFGLVFSSALDLQKSPAPFTTFPLCSCASTLGC